MLLNDLKNDGLIDPPQFLCTNTHYLCRMGSVAYGVSQNFSDNDLYGVCVPPKYYIFDSGYIHGFDKTPPDFKVWQKHHVFDKTGRSYDISIYGIVNYFRLALDNNPNVIDSLFVDREHVLHSTSMWETVRNNRKLFLHKGAIKKMVSYAFSQLQKANNCLKYIEDIRKFEEDNGIPHSTTYEQATLNYSHLDQYQELWKSGNSKTSRFQSQKILGFDSKFLYHVYRLIDQAVYILENCDLQLQVPERIEKMIAIRKGEIAHKEIVQYFEETEKKINFLIENSKLREKPDTNGVRNLLLSCLESHYGELSSFAHKSDAELAMKEIVAVLSKYNVGG